jgi:hypothetical protein
MEKTTIKQLDALVVMSWRSGPFAYVFFIRQGKPLSNLLTMRGNSC